MKKNKFFYFFILIIATNGYSQKDFVAELKKDPFYPLNKNIRKFRNSIKCCEYPREDSLYSPSSKCKAYCFVKYGNDSINIGSVNFYFPVLELNKENKITYLIYTNFHKAEDSIQVEQNVNRNFNLLFDYFNENFETKEKGNKYKEALKTKNLIFSWGKKYYEVHLSKSMPEKRWDGKFFSIINVEIEYNENFRVVR